MSTCITHAFVGVVTARALFGRRYGWRLPVLAVACSAGPDLDIVLHRFGVQYADLWGHRGMTHSLLFALLLSVVVVTLAFRRQARFGRGAWWGLVGFFFALTASHGFIDAFTDGGLGIAFFSPFDTTRYFMPWQPLVVPYIALGPNLSEHGARMMLSELTWVWVPVGGLSLVISLARRRIGRGAGPQPGAGAS
jgi:inner membrane protein